MAVGSRTLAKTDSCRKNPSKKGACRTAWRQIEIFHDLAVCVGTTIVVGTYNEEIFLKISEQFAECLAASAGTLCQS
jgi:hypothetical protein